MFRRASKPTAPPEWMIVGLGNPGGEYRGTRHNVGFDLLDLLAQRHRIRLDKSRHQARYGQGRIGETSVLLVRPLTYMNLSGRAVAPLAKLHNLPPSRVLVAADDFALALGRIRLKPKGSAGGHNGHKSLIEALRTDEYPRLKIGIGEAGKGAAIQHVLGGFNREERETIDQAIERAADCVEAILTRGVEAAMNECNGGQGP